MRVAFNIVFANNSTDVRSDDEEEEGEDAEEKEKAKKRERERGKGKKAVEGGVTTGAAVNGLNSKSKSNANLINDDKTFAEVLQQGTDIRKKDL